MGYDIVAVGECLVDFIGSPSQSGKLCMEGNAGGAPANVLACASRLGLRTALISKLGEDGFGRFLLQELEKTGIDIRYMAVTPDYPTTIAVVTLDETGNRSFGFYRSQTADIMLRKAEINFPVLGSSRVFHFGSVSMTAQPAREATLAAAAYAKEHGVLVSFDPNLREVLWQDKETARTVILQGMAYADVVKVSGEELAFLSGKADVDAGLEMLAQEFHPKLLVATLGPQGCVCRCRAGRFASLAYDVPCVDTTGAGDAFWGAALFGILNAGKGIDDFMPEEVRSLLDFANACGSLTTMHKGAIPAMPSREEIYTCMRHTPRCVNK